MPKRSGPISVPAQIRQGHGHAQCALVLDEIEQVVLRAAPIDPGNNVKDAICVHCRDD